MAGSPSFFELSEADCRALLQRLRIGRLAFIAENRVDIHPLAYVLSGDWLYMRSAYGTRLEALERHPYAAFEVDDIRGPFDWESIVVHGTIYVLEPRGNDTDQKAYAAAVAAVRSVLPEAFTPDDPAPHRSTVYGLRIDAIKGRGAGAHHPARTPVIPSTRRRPHRADGT